MKYSIINLLLLIFLISSTMFGCKTEEQTGSSTVTPGITETVQNSFEIPSAKKIKEELKVKVDENIKLITTSADDKEKKSAIENINKLCEENPSDFSLFSYLIQNSDNEVSKAGIKALEKCYAGKMTEEQKTEEFEILSACLKHPVDYIRCDAINTMAYISDTNERTTKQTEFLREGLKDKSANVRITAIQRLAQINDKESIDPIKEIMNGSDESEVRAAAMRALERFGTDITADLMNFLDKGDSHLKSYAIDVLSRKKDKKLIPKLVEFLDDKSSTIIGKKYDNEITIAYCGPRETIQGTAILGLENITGEKFKGKDNDEITSKWKEWYKKNKDIK